MKLEVGESLGYSYLRHVQRCWLVQTNWKASEHWDKRLTDDELEQVAVLAAAMAMAMDAELEAWPGPLPLPARASAVWRYQGRLDLMQGQGRPRLGWRR